MDEALSFLPFAERLAGAARAAIRPWIDRPGAVADKNEGGAYDPVTDADRAAERAMRSLIEAHHPDHGIVGEEFGDRDAQGPWSWSLDPIDGTRAFVCGLPGWTVLIALLHRGEPLIGLIDAPQMDETYVGAPGGAWLVKHGIRKSIGTSGCAQLSQARLATTDPFLFVDAEAERFDRVRRAVRLTRYGFDAYAYARLAAGSIDLVVESGLKPHDYMALVPVIRSAGGMVGNWTGGADLADGRIIAAASPSLFEAAIRTMAG